MTTRIPEVPQTDEGTATAFAFIMSRHRMVPEKSDELNTACSCGHVETLDGEGWAMHIGRDLVDWMHKHTQIDDMFRAYTTEDDQMWVESRSAREVKEVSKRKDVYFVRIRKHSFQHFVVEELTDF